ncbi:DUF5681 domain-containing protein [Desulfovibrio sp. OttesenSCG-928-M14]|nr:DUF5681 domain-containing protein [Desulfovibrio sp. OttesenSCG-928-M14]
MTFQPGQSGNPAGRPKGSVNKNLAMLRDAVEKVLPLVVDRALAGDHEAQKLILEKGLPKLRAVEAPIEFILPDAGELSPARAVLLQAAAGVLPLSCAREVVRELVPILSQERQALEQKQHPQNAYANAYLTKIFNDYSKS